MGKKNELDFGKTSLHFFAISLVTVFIALLIAWLIIARSGEFTFWAIIPFLIGFPVSILINITIARKTIRRSQSDSPKRGPTNEELK